MVPCCRYTDVWMSMYNTIQNTNNSALCFGILANKIEIDNAGTSVEAQQCIVDNICLFILDS